MKLVEIKDVRIGQVWQFGENMCRCFVVERTMKTKTCGATYQAFDCPTMPEECKGELYIKDYDMPKIPHGRLIGKLGITHRTEDGKLVEIPHATEFEVDDIVRHENGKTGVIVKINNVGFAIGYEYSINCGSEGFNDTFEYLTKIGILGVTHEFVNDREA